jgi:hypothetical protein
MRRKESGPSAKKGEKYMKRPIAALVLLASGCAMQYPQTADEFRQQVPGAFMGRVQTFEADRPFREVAKTFQAKAPECLNVSVRTAEHSGTSYSNILTTYKPTVLVTDKKAELHVQRRFQGNVIIPGNEPPGGLYTLVADATPLDRGRTRIDIYGPSRGADTLTRAVTGWATGENVGCPDMTKN